MLPYKVSFANMLFMCRILLLLRRKKNTNNVYNQILACYVDEKESFEITSWQKFCRYTKEVKSRQNKTKIIFSLMLLDPPLS